MKIFDKKFAGAIILTQEGTILLQQRDDNPSIINPGMITLFGGSIEKDENPDHAILREVKEEITLNVSKEDISLFGIYNKEQITHGEDCTCYIYVIKGINKNSIDIKEGKGFVEINKNDNLEKLNLSLLTRTVLIDFFKNK